MQGVLSTALNQAVDDRLIPSNPASRVKKAATREQAPMRSLSTFYPNRPQHHPTQGDGLQAALDDNPAHQPP